MFSKFLLPNVGINNERPNQKTGNNTIALVNDKSIPNILINGITLKIDLILYFLLLKLLPLCSIVLIIITFRPSILLINEFSM